MNDQYNQLIKIPSPKLSVIPPTVVFENFEIVEFQIDKICTYLKDVEVTEETISSNKKLVANIRKACNQLDRYRIDVKKELLEPYNELEKKIKELNKKVSSAEETIRVQLRDFEELRREQKEREIEEIFHKRVVHYPYNLYLDFDKFIKPQHLNKSTPMSTVEHEMVEWLETRKSEINTLLLVGKEKMSEDELLDLYFKRNYNLSTTLELVLMTPAPVPADKEESKPKKLWTTFTVDSDYEDLVEKYLRENEIEFQKKVTEWI